MAAIAIIHFANAPKGQSRSGMAGTMGYAAKEEKTLWQGRRLVSGYNCRPESAYDDFMRTKLLYHKTGGRLFYHMVQSFPKDADVDPVKAHAAALKLAEWFEGREVLVCTHVDRDHIHSHFVINSVSLEDGKKLHISKPELEELRKLNDQVCLEFGLPVFQPQEKKQGRSVSNAEYHSAVKGKSWKFRLMNTIDECMKYAKTRDEFISLIRGEGYDVKWSDTGKAITYTTPGGKKCRDIKLHDAKYLKEVMEREFGIRAALIAGGAEAAEPARAATGTRSAGDASHRRGVGEAERFADSHWRTAGGADHYPGTSASPAEPVAGAVGSAGPDQSGGGNEYRAERDQDSAETGWEKERAAVFAAQTLAAGVPSVPGPVAAPTGDISIGGSLLELGRALELVQSTAPMKDSTTMPGHTDRRTLAKEREKKIAMGHKPDDHAEQQFWQQTM